MTAVRRGTSRAAELAHRHGRALATLLVVALSGLVLFPVWVWRAGTDRRALERLRLDERRELYVETLRDARAVCAAAEAQADLRHRCNELADFLEHFPDCDTECRTFLQSVQHRAAR